ncbi:MAG TPA: hypothetical protein VJM15_05250 [Sphingomicrobium sp.]|nr:hypothetical protein [Sphingomicrobium sp.]
MNRLAAFLLAILFATVTVSSACVAAPSDWLRFTLDGEGSGGRIHASFRDESRARGDGNWSTGFDPSDLAGLDVASFRASGSRPIHFSLVREAGRLDCSGNGGDRHAAGNCTFAPDPAFTQLLASRGIGQPTRAEAFGLMALDVRRALVDGLVAAGYPTPSIDDLMALTALGANRAYIDGMARAGYRPKSLKSLIEFKALGITPEWISGFARIGYANMPGDDLVQLKALGVTPDFIAGFNRAGYGRLAVDQLVQLKALGVTPDYALAANRQADRRLSVDQLVEMKALGLGPRRR